MLPTPESRGGRAARVAGNPIKLFVSHVWEENDDYFRVLSSSSDSNFYYQNFSTPDTRPTGDKEALREIAQADRARESRYRPQQPDPQAR